MKVLVVLVLSITVGPILSEPACPLEPTNCSCSWGPSNAYELICPKDVQLEIQDSLIIGSFLPDHYIQLQCTNMNDWEKLSLVSGLKIGKIKSVSLRFCPLPGISFKELLASMGIPSTTKLQVQSHGNIKNGLTQRHLEGLSELTTLHLNMNGLTELPEDLFQDLGNLTWLDLRNNNVLLPKGIFRSIPKLEVLELGGNNISYLEPGIFRNLTKLRLLNLWGNRLQNLTRATFSDVPNLENLDLNNNGLQTLPPDVFADLISLKKINLFANNFNWLPQSLFRSTSQLETIQIYSNRRALETLPPALFQNLKSLKELNLSSCNMSYLPEDLLVNCTSLEKLILRQNLLTSLPPGIFQDLSEVKEINLSENQLSSLPDAVFSKLYKVKILNLSKNELTAISKDLFSNLGELENLNLSQNKIKEIHSHAFQVTGNLVTLDLSHNALTDLRKKYMTPFGYDSVFQSLVKMEHLYLSHNNLNAIYADWRISMTYLGILDLSYNNFTNITLYDMQFTSTSLAIDLSYNKISLIDFDEADELVRQKYAEVKSGVQENNSVKVILKGNSLVCDCKAYHLVRYFRDELPEVKLIAELNGAGLTCAGEPKILNGTEVQSVDPRLLVCEVLEEDCPVNCSCFFRPRDKALIVDCADRGLTNMPKDIPHDFRTTSLTNHTELNLSYNQLTRIPHLLGSGYTRVTNLNLSYNNLTSVNLTSFHKNLQVVELNNNNLTRVNQETLRVLKGLKLLESVTLQKNPWICDCQTKEFHSFLQSNFKKIPFINNITCSNGVSLALMTAGELCPFTSVAIGIASMVIAFLGLVIGGSIALYYRYQREIKIWLYAHRMCLWLVTEEELDKDKLYDAFVSYSHQDEKFITEDLQPMLENGNPKYKLCLHYRDWVVGEFIPNQIARSVEDSRRTIVVLSPNFLESVWGRMEFRTAHSQALSEGRARVIVILYGDIPTDGLDPELKAYLSTNTYVKWGDPWFWDKLRYALPHPPELTKGIPLLSRQSVRRNGTEKLINGINTNSTTTTTPPADSLIIEPLKTLSNSKPV